MADLATEFQNHSGWHDGLVRLFERSTAAAKILSYIVLAAVAPLSAAANDDTQLIYNASFGHGSLASSVDSLLIGPLQTGDSQLAGTFPIWMTQPGTIEIGITRPAVPIVGPVSAGLFATPVRFDVGSLFVLQATFVAPVGPHNIGNIWAVTVGGRTGGVGDLLAENRIAATFQVRGGGARLNVVGATAPANQQNVPQDIYDAIFDPADPQPFTLELLVDRTTGNGSAALRVADSVFFADFQMETFTADSGPAITAVGPSIAISNAPGQSASVRVRNFKIFTVRRR